MGKRADCRVDKAVRVLLWDFGTLNAGFKLENAIRGYFG